VAICCGDIKYFASSLMQNVNVFSELYITVFRKPRFYTTLWLSKSTAGTSIVPYLLGLPNGSLKICVPHPIHEMI